MVIRFTATVTSSGGGSLTDATQIIASRTTGYDGMGVSFTTDLSDAHSKTHAIFWDFGGTTTNWPLLPSGMADRDRNTAFGPVAAHTFYTGATTVTCDIYSGADWQRLTKVITATDQDTVFAGTKTIALATDSDWTGKPTGAQESSTMADALTKMRAGGADQRIVIKGGTTVTLASGNDDLQTSEMAGRTLKHRICFTTYSGFGTSTRPIIDVATNDGSFSVNEVEHVDSEYAWQNLEILGTYDPTTGQGAGRVKGIWIHSACIGGNFTIDNCKMTKVQRGISQDGTAGADMTLVVTDTEITDWEDYGAWVKSCNHNFAGTAIYVDPLTINGTEGKLLGGVTNYPDHGCIRASAGFICSRSKCYKTVFHSWSSAGKGWQPCDRNETGPTSDGDAKYSITQCFYEGATCVSNSSENTTQDNCFAAYFVIACNQFLGCTGTYNNTTTAGGMMVIGKGNTVIQNNVVTIPNVSPIPAWNPARLFINLNPGTLNHTATNLAKPIVIKGNSFIDLRASGIATDSEVIRTDVGTVPGWTDVTNTGNIYHAPSRSSPTIVSNLNTSDTVTPACLGSRFTGDGSRINPTPVGVGSSANYEPSTGSGAIGNTTAANSPVYDFDLNIRSAVVGGLTRTTYTDGPFEVALES